MLNTSEVGAEKQVCVGVGRHVSVHIQYILSQNVFSDLWCQFHCFWVMKTPRKDQNGRVVFGCESADSFWEMKVISSI